MKNMVYKISPEGSKLYVARDLYSAHLWVVQ